VRSGEALEALSRPGLLVFDKTGTLTSPRLAVARVAPFDGAGEEELLRAAGSLGLASSHPAAAALVEAMRRRGLEPLPIAAPRSFPGLGVSGRAGGEELAMGRPVFVLPRCRGTAALPAEPAGEEESPVLVARGGRLLGWIGLREEVKPEARQVIDAARAAGFEVAVLTGDTRAKGEALGRALGVEVQAGLLPDGKVAWVEARRRGGRPVAVVGDGWNDAPVLQAADAGIALSTGVELAREAAAAVLLAPDGSLAAIPRLLRIARRTRALVRRNLFWAFGYNAAGMALAAAGLVPPILAALLMVLSSLFVVSGSVKRLD
jgi:Cu+-exporting ATPase